MPVMAGFWGEEASSSPVTGAGSSDGAYILYRPPSRGGPREGKLAQNQPPVLAAETKGHVQIGPIEAAIGAFVRLLAAVDGVEEGVGPVAEADLRIVVAHRSTE